MKLQTISLSSCAAHIMQDCYLFQPKHIFDLWESFHDLTFLLDRKKSWVSYYRWQFLKPFITLLVNKTWTLNTHTEEKYISQTHILCYSIVKIELIKTYLRYSVFVIWHKRTLHNTHNGPYLSHWHSYMAWLQSILMCGLIMWKSLPQCTKFKNSIEFYELIFAVNSFQISWMM